MPVFNKMVYNGTEYILGGGGNIGEPLNLRVTKSGLDATIKWEDNEIGTIPPTTFQKSELVRKIGSAPTSPSDGDLVVTETVKDTYKTTGYVDQGLTDGETYYYRVFSYSDLGGISYCDAVSITAGVTERPDIDDFVQTSHYSGYIYGLHAIGIGGNGEYVYIGRDSSSLTQHTATNGDIANFDATPQSSLSYQSRGLRCKSDGSVLYSFMDSSGIYQIDMSTPYSLTGATVNNYSVGYSICGGSLSYDGTKMYMGIWDNNYTKQFLEYTLSTPRDASSIGTPTFHTANEVTGSGDAFIYCTQISPTGKKMYLAGTDGKIHQYNLSTPYDWSTAVYYGYLDTGFFARCPFQFLEDGQTIYIGNMNNKDLYQYTAS